MPLDEAWAAAVVAACDPVFQRAEVGFTHQVVDDEGTPALLWEATPELFAARYPDSEVVESYGDGWPPPCLDWWVHPEPSRERLRLTTEGWNLPEVYLDLHGRGDVDGMSLAAVVAALLRVPLR